MGEQNFLMPNYPESAELGDKGVRMVADAVADELHWIFRVKEQADLGIDGEIELLDDNRECTGELLAVQIKCGQSFFKEKCDYGYVFRCSEDKVNYWIKLSLPVVLCLCNNLSGKIYWCHVTVDTVYKLKSGYKIIVPFENILDSENSYKLKMVLKSAPSIIEVSESAIFKYLYERYKHNIEICPDIEIPRDFYKLSFLAKISGELYIIGTVIDKYGFFDINDVIEDIDLYYKNRKMLGWTEYNVKSTLLICFVSESIEHLNLKNDILDLLKANEKEIEFSRLHLCKKYLSAELIREDGAAIWFYNADGTIDEGQIFSTNKFD